MRTRIFIAAIFGCVMSSSALTHIDYDESWYLVWDGDPFYSFSPTSSEIRNLNCHWESTLGRQASAHIRVVSGNATVNTGTTPSVSLHDTRGNVTVAISRASLYHEFDDSERFVSFVAEGFGCPSQPYHQIEKPKMTVNGGTTNITISWGVKYQSDNHMVAAEVYRSELTDDGLTQKTPYELVYGEYDEDKVKSGSYSWTDYSVKLGVPYSYCVRVYGIGIIDDTKTLMIGYDTGGDFRTSDAGTAQTEACMIIYENLRGATPRNPSYYIPGNVVSFGNPSPIPGGIFQGWTPEGIPSTATGRQIVSANWILDKFNVAFDGNGGTLNDYGIGLVSSIMEYGDEIVAPKVTRVGYTFAGWSPGVAVTVPANDVTYIAQWRVNRYQVTFDANGGEGGKSEELDYGSVIEMPSVTRTGYTFMGWDSPVAATVPTNDVTYVARWRVNKYSVVFDANGGDGDTSVDQVDYDAKIVTPTVTRFGYALDGWQTETGQRVVPDYQGKISKLTSEDGGVVTLYAVWKAPKFYVNASGALWYAEQNSVSDIIVPDGVINITSQPFRYFGPARIILPQSLRNIDDWAFEDFGNLMDITIPDNSVTNIGKGAFAECTNLTSVVIPGSVVTVGTQAFSGCSEVTNLVISYGLHDIGWYAFSACTKLANLQIPGSVTNIGAGAFSDCSSLTSVTMPRSVTRIGGYAFGCCSKLTIVHVVMGDKARIKGLLEDSGFDTSGVTFVEDVAWNPDPVPPTPVISHTVTFNANGGSVSQSTLVVVNGTEVGTLPVATRDGWIFNGWFTAASGGTEITAETIVIGDVTYYAQWTEITATSNVKLMVPYGELWDDLKGTFLNSDVMLVEDEFVAGQFAYVNPIEFGDHKVTSAIGQLPVLSLPGFTFAGWYDTPYGGTENRSWTNPPENGRITATSQVPLDDVVYYAYFVPNKCTVVLNTNGGDISNIVMEVDAGLDISDLLWSIGTEIQNKEGTWFVPTKEGSQFKGWRIVAESSGTEYFPVGLNFGYRFVEDVTLYAQWTANRYTVTFNANGGEGGWSRSMDYGATIDVPTVTRTGTLSRDGLRRCCLPFLRMA